MTTTPPQTMRALCQTHYGPPAKVLSLQQLPVPTPKPEEVLIKVHCTSPHAGDWHLIRGTPRIVRLMFGLFRPSNQVPGTDAAGVIAATGENVTTFKPGDRVFADLSATHFGAFAEYATCAAANVAHIPPAHTFRTAAPLGVSALAALHAVRDHARVNDPPGKRVLVMGASGGVGSFAAQMARAYGARVTAVCRASKVGAVKRLGVDVLDSEKDDLFGLGEVFDAVVDCAMFRSPSEYVRVLKEGGRYVGVGGDEKFLFRMMFGLGWWMTSVKKRPASFVDSKPNKEDLDTIAGLVQEGKVVPLLDEERFTLEDLPRAIQKIEERRVIGKIVVDVVQEENQS